VANMDEIERKAQQRRERIEAARAALAARYASDPAAVAGFNGKMARFAQARKREQQRFEHLVLGKPRPKLRADSLVRPEGMSRQEWKIRRRELLAQGVVLEPGIEEVVQRREQAFNSRATPETLALAGVHHDGMNQLELNGTITKDEREWATQIANVHRSIEADVGIKVASLEARVDSTTRPPVVAERIHSVRMHAAYGFWRDMLPAPKGLVLDMIVGDAIGYTVAAKRYRVHNRRAKRLLLEAIKRWPLCVAHAFSVVDRDMVDAMNRAVDPGTSITAPSVPVASYAVARALEEGRERTDEPYLLPPIDPVFLNDRGHLKEWADIAEIIRHRVFGDGEDREQKAA